MGRLRPGELRAGWRWAAGIAALSSLLLALFLLSRIQSSHSAATPAVPVPAPPAADSEDEATLTTVHDTVRRGDTFSGFLLRNRLSVQDLGRVLDCTRRLQLFSPREMRPGQELNMTCDEYGRLIRMSFTLSPEETYIYESRGDSLIAYQQPVARDIRLRKIEGEITTTFDDAVRQAGGDYRLTLKLADVFAYDVDFFTEVHRGDRFSLLVEERFADGQFVGYGEVLYGRYDGLRAKSTAIWYQPEGASKGGYYDQKGRAMRKVFLRSPLNYRRISSLFTNARFHPILKTWRPHHGVDYAAPEGTPVVAVADGTVEFAGWRGGYGRLLELRHAARMETIYGHLSRFARDMSAGAHVAQGEVIGYVGRTGLATGPHLHYEVLAGGARLNPLNLKNLPAEPIPAGQQARYGDYAQRLEDLERVLLAGQILPSFRPAQLQAALAQLQAEGVSPSLR